MECTTYQNLAIFTHVLELSTLLLITSVAIHFPGANYLLKMARILSKGPSFHWDQSYDLIWRLFVKNFLSGIVARPSISIEANNSILSNLWLFPYIWTPFGNSPGFCPVTLWANPRLSSFSLLLRPRSHCSVFVQTEGKYPFLWNCSHYSAQKPTRMEVFKNALQSGYLPKRMSLKTLWISVNAQ